MSRPANSADAGVQQELFGDVTTRPPGLRYETELLSVTDERALLRELAALPFAKASYKEWTARRRVVSYGGRFDFSRNMLREAQPLAEFLHPLRAQVAAWSGLPEERFQHALVSEYSPGTPLGWHRDVPDFEAILGVSLGGTARMRWRPYPPSSGNARTTFTLDLAPRSAYLMQGASRWDWQHAVSPTKTLRYSITFRTLRHLATPPLAFAAARR